MALIACAGCGSEISSFAVECAKCGTRPASAEHLEWEAPSTSSAGYSAAEYEALVARSPRRSGVPWLLAVLVVVGVVLGGFAIWDRVSGSQSSAQPAAADAGVPTSSQLREWWRVHQGEAATELWAQHVDGLKMVGSLVEVATPFADSLAGAREAMGVCSFFSKVRVAYPGVGIVRVVGPDGDPLATC